MDARPPATLKPDTSSGFVPAYRPSALHISLVHSITQLDAGLARFHVHPQWMTRLRRDAYIVNAQASASIEGNPLTVEQAAAVIERYEARGIGRSPPDEREIIQHYDYFETVRGLPIDGAPDLTLEEMERTHRRLLDGVLPAQKTPGRFRGPDNDSYVSVGRLEATPPARVKAELHALQEWYYTSGLELPAPIRIAIWFHEFESIHPFRDGNGRVGRALTHRLLFTDGFSNVVFVALDRPFNEDRPSYYRALASVHETGGFYAWVEYFLQSVKESYESSLRLLDQLAQMPSELTGAAKAVLEYVFRSGRTSLRLKDVAAALSQYRSITISVALTRLGREGFLVHNGKVGQSSRWGPGPKLEAILARPVGRL